MNPLRLSLPGSHALLNRRSALAEGLEAARRLVPIGLTLAVVAFLVVALRYAIFEHFHNGDLALRAILEATGTR